MKSWYLLGVLPILVGALFLVSNKNSLTGAFEGVGVELFYSPNCGCCVQYISYLNSNHFDVSASKTNYVESVKEELNIPSEMWSCHTSKIGNYFVEGHVPVEAVQKLLDEQPDIDGIALPGMPSGSPGMPGAKSHFTIYSVKDGKVVGVFIEI